MRHILAGCTANAWRWVLVGFLGALMAPQLGGQTTTGSHTPGSVTDYAIPLSAGTTNLSISVTGSPTAYSYLLLKAGNVPTDADYDFRAAAAGQPNALHIEAADLAETNYVLRVRTPIESQAHSFTLTIATNQEALGTATHPITKRLEFFATGEVNPGQWRYYRVDVAGDLPGWQLLLESSQVYPDVYVQRGAVPTPSNYLKRSQGALNDVLAFAGVELVPGDYFIGLYVPPSAPTPLSFDLRGKTIHFTELTWDPGLSHEGTEIHSQTHADAGYFYFKVTTQHSLAGGWRTALNVLQGEAGVFLSRGEAPTPASAGFGSNREGADGFVIEPKEFSPGEDWYFMVEAAADSAWTLMTGEPYVENLGTLTVTGSSGSGPLMIGPEGIRYFRTAVPPNTLGWRLWLQGTDETILVKDNAVPHEGLNDLSQAGQMLVVPGYLVGGQLYFIGVMGDPGALIDLDSRVHTVSQLPFLANTTVTNSGFGYRTYRVSVPPDQLAWQVSVVAHLGNPNLAVRRNTVPNESNNDAYSEVPGEVTDSVTLVPPALGDGTFYITVYGVGEHAFTLQSGTPVITDIPFTSTVTNDDPLRAGWRFYRVANITEQLGVLGWNLWLTNHAPGTRIAIRRNAVPGLWNFRTPKESSAGHHDLLSLTDFLQNPGHQADIWYVGVYHPAAPLGEFTLHSGELGAEPLAADGGVAVRSEVTNAKWQFFRVDVPPDILGWDLRLTNVTRGLPRLVVRKDVLPVSLVNLAFSSPINGTNWPSGSQWAALADWTERDLSADGSKDENGRVLSMGWRRPLEAGTYYVGVLNKSGDTNAMSYHVASRLIGSGRSLEVTALPYEGGSATNLSLAARDIDYYRVSVPDDVPSWKVRLRVLQGDAVLAVSHGTLPNITARANGSVTNTLTAGKKMKKDGNEHFVLLPNLVATNLMPGDYYLAVISEGLAGSENRRIGTGAAQYVLESLGAMPRIDLGNLDETDLLRIDQLEGGESIAYHFTTVPDLLGFEIRLEDRVGNPVAVSRGLRALADPGLASSIGGVSSDVYGNEGGQTSGAVASSHRITVADPYSEETIMVKARALSGDYPDAAYALRVRRLVPESLAFDGGTIEVVEQITPWQFFMVNVPEGALGWDLRVTNVVAGTPKLVVSREALGILLSTSSGFNPGVATNWFAWQRWAPGKDWTGRSLAADGLVNEEGRVLAMGMGQPLEPGLYYVGVYTGSTVDNPATYSVASRGIGNGFSIPVDDLSFTEGSLSGMGLPPREAAYYRVVVPTNAASWKVKLEATDGESMLVVLSNSIPNILTGGSGAAGKSLRKPGNEHYLRLPSPSQSVLTPGTNYLAVISEGQEPPSANAIGTGNSSYFLTSSGELAVLDLGLAGDVEIVRNDWLEAGEVRAYRVSVPEGYSSLEARLEVTSGTPVMVLRGGIEFPDPGAGSIKSGVGAVSKEIYGTEGGTNIVLGLGEANSQQINLPVTTNATFTLLVKARPQGTTFLDANYTLRVRGINAQLVDFDGGTLTVTNQAPNTWRYFVIEVPPEAEGWDVRLTDVALGMPRLVVAKDELPASITTRPWGRPGSVTEWPPGSQWAAGPDWTRRTLSPDGSVVEDGRILAMGMGQPLEPGTYYVGVINSTGTSPMNYTLVSRGIGSGFAIPVTELAYAGDPSDTLSPTVTVADLAPREAAYFRVEVPTNAPSWKVRLSGLTGEALLLVAQGALPNVDTGRPPVPGKAMQKAGNEHFVLAPTGAATQLAGGTYYLAVVGEGINPSSASRIGTGSTSFTLTSEGPLPVTALGSVELGHPLSLAAELEGGEVMAYSFTVRSNTAAVELRLDDRVGNPVMVVAPGAALPVPGATVESSQDVYGQDGGVSILAGASNTLTLSNPTNGLHTLLIKARALGSVHPDASYLLRLRELPAPTLSFSAEYNTPGTTHTVAGTLENNQRAFFRVEVPDYHADNTPVLGWELRLSQSSGTAFVRARRDLLPSDLHTAGMAFAPAAAVLTPPFLTAGTWYVEVRGSNTTAYTLSSRSLILQRPAWSMPVEGEPSSTPGLTLPEFGDSGVDTEGLALAGDQGFDLNQGWSHYYAVDVPAGNLGLMRVQLDAISGNPDLYARLDLPPTVSHRTDGRAGSLLDRALLGTTTEYANWVPLNGREESELPSGRWYLAVRATGTANARYRLRLSTGTVEDLELAAGTKTQQVLAGGDWRYYRVHVPADTPTNWNISISQQSGDVVLYLRDTIPPGYGSSNVLAQLKDWKSDNKDNATYPNFPLPGTYTLTVPPVRPNHVYYLGFRANNDASFSVGSSMDPEHDPRYPVPPLIEFYGGSIDTTIEPHSALAYRVITPADAARWKHSTAHALDVKIHIRNGFYPAMTSSDHWVSTVPNSTLNRFLGTWPWLPEQTYFLVATNTSASPQPFTFLLEGTSVVVDDDDNDGMLDAWEMEWFGTLSQRSDGDFDGDGVSNLDEFLEGTAPTDSRSLRPRLQVETGNGVVFVDPLLSHYPYRSVVLLEALPDPGYEFIGWSGDVFGRSNPLSLLLNSSKTVVALFRVPGDDFIQRVVLDEWTGSAAGSNLGATLEPGEPAHGEEEGGASVWWTWLAAYSGPARFTVAAEGFDPLLAVYTGDTVEALTLVAADVNGVEPGVSQVEFVAEAGTWYHVAVDGWEGGQGALLLDYGMSQLVAFEAPTWTSTGSFEVTLLSGPGETYRLEVSTDLRSWTPLTNVVNQAGTVLVEDSNTGSGTTRFYRAVEP